MKSQQEAASLSNLQETLVVIVGVCIIFCYASYYELLTHILQVYVGCIIHNFPFASKVNKKTSVLSESPQV